MLVDSEHVLLELESYIASRSSHGRNDLLLKITELKTAHTVTEGLPEKAIRLFGTQLSEDLIRTHPGKAPADEDSDRAPAMATAPGHRSPNGTEEHHDTDTASTG
jgi:hypothetical protein